MQTTADTLSAEIGSRTVSVEPAAIQVDGETVAPIAEGTKSVTVSAESGRLQVTADGRTVYDAKF
jgi:hypothetical protein